MKKVRILLPATIILIICSIIFVACQKSASGTSGSTTDNPASITTASSVDDESEVVYNDVFNNVVGVNSDAGFGTGVGVYSGTGSITPSTHTTNGVAGVNGIDSCYTVTIMPAGRGIYPKTITVDFGNGCTGGDGHTRSGQIITVFSGPITVSGNTATTTFNNYYYDSISVQGTHIITNASTDTTLILTRTVQNGKLTTPSGNYIEVNRTHTWTLISGILSILHPATMQFSVTGSSTGTASVSGITLQWTTQVIKPLLKALDCRWFESGQVQITYSSATGTLDYGDGTCDNKATLTVGSKTYNITLH